MEFDLFFELAVPEHGGRGESQVFAETLGELALADELGFTTAWVVEHHFMREYSHSSAPELFLAAASQRTRRLRLGHGVVVLPYNHAVRVAERAATLDVLSGGRVELGVGRGFSPKEYAAFGSDMARSREIVDESLAVIRQAFSGRPVDFQGSHYQLEDLEVLPGVVQDPHPPLWTAAVSPETFTWAAREGLGALAGPFKPWFLVKQDLKEFRRAWREAWPEGAPPRANPRFGMTIGVLCLEDGDRARELARQPFTWYYERLLGQTRPVLEKFQESYDYYQKLGRLQPLLKRAVRLSLLEAMGMVVVGSPEECIEKLERYRAAGVDHLLMAVGAGALPTEVTQESLRTLAERVLPHFNGDSS
ncbi:monooxygenase [Thiohalorhabdus denitrificans]|uniref:Flavin-dependent oxidoreductase, luciferase family (Includes alkanesulfonate monooxygenase SsuD and methylene tetrahydromethanopterin reductase) n=1 Tax=Thiohalorhabdus denitrificans TaxID=381306 RepID=A0A0P9EGU3_9GAMM|nr:LLM class flavin-dependent oxidoreductase [Thiohalorhabdus denitrificans]KPV41742.1 monooxygenase [Thiohalorhabdus denitrificans]SCY53640.1 Flavin-dependent oxidoreductase, luciferase family (includes alkanesulfonate monooxygenase SsuD and methylene tetrahydromethanopterin reductase) [Thiohalorhabdus denitrificans]